MEHLVHEKGSVLITLNPYQGLKRKNEPSAWQSHCMVLITLNPYQGLKQPSAAKCDALFQRSNYSESLSGIETYLHSPGRR